MGSRRTDGHGVARRQDSELIYRAAPTVMHRTLNHPGETTVGTSGMLGRSDQIRALERKEKQHRILVVVRVTPQHRRGIDIAAGRLF